MAELVLRVAVGNGGVLKDAGFSGIEAHGIQQDSQEKRGLRFPEVRMPISPKAVPGEVKPKKKPGEFQSRANTPESPEMAVSGAAVDGIIEPRPSPVGFERGFEFFGWLDDAARQFVVPHGKQVGRGGGEVTVEVVEAGEF